MADSNDPRFPSDDDNELNRKRDPEGDDLDLDDDIDDFDDDLEDYLDDFDVDDYDEDDEDDEDEEDENEELEPLLEHFQGDDYRIVDLKDLSSLDDIEDELSTALTPTLTFDEVLYRLVRESEDLPNNELAALSALAQPDKEQLRRIWPQIHVMRRRAVTAVISELYAALFALDYSAVLRVAMDDEDAVVRRFALLGLSSEGAAQDLLGRYVQYLQADEDVEVRAAAAAALGAYILEGELEELDSAMAMRAEQVLMSVLADSRQAPAVQCRALESIAFSGELGVRQLIEEAYYSPEEERRLSALVAMGRSADIRWRRLARAELTNPDAAMRAQAAYACGELEARSALNDLLRLLGDRNQGVRLAAMTALGHIGGPQAREALLAIQATGDEVEAFTAEEALEEMDFYASAQAASVPLFDETEAGEDDDDELLDWDDRGDEDDDLGEYE